MNEGKIRGWLWKQGPQLKKWKHRYFIMHFTYLEYFDTEKDSSANGTALGSIPLGMVVCYVPFKNETDRPYSFALQTPDRTFYLSTECEAEMKRWVDSIKQAIHDIFVHQVNHHLPTAQTYADPVEKKDDGIRALTRGITKRFLVWKEPKEKESPQIDITSPISSVSTFSSPPTPSVAPHSVIPTPLPPRTLPVTPSHPVAIHESTSQPVEVSPDNSPRSPPATSPLPSPAKHKQEVDQESPPTPPSKPLTPYRPPAVPARHFSPLPSTPKSPPPLPERVMKPKGLVRPPRPHMKPPTSLTPSRSLPHIPSPNPTFAPDPLNRSPSPNLDTRKANSNHTTTNNETNVTSGNSTTYNIQSVDSLVINNNITIHCSPDPPPLSLSDATYNEEQNGDKIVRMFGSSIPLKIQVVRALRKLGFTVYQIEFVWSEHTWTVFRRFTQFDELDGYLAGVMRPDFVLPSKTLKHNFKDKFVEKRREVLDMYMGGCSARAAQIMTSRKARKQWFKFIKPAQLGDLRGIHFSFDIFATPDQQTFLD